MPLTFAEQDLAALEASCRSERDCARRARENRLQRGTAFHASRPFRAVYPADQFVLARWRRPQVDLADGSDVAAALKAARALNGRQSLAKALARLVPEKLAGTILDQMKLSGNLADQGNAVLDKVGTAVNGWLVRPVGSEGYRTAEVTLGVSIHARLMPAPWKQGPSLACIS